MGAVLVILAISRLAQVEQGHRDRALVAETPPDLQRLAAEAHRSLVLALHVGHLAQVDQLL